MQEGAKAVIPHMLKSRISHRLTPEGFLTIRAPAVCSCPCTIPVLVPTQAHLCSHTAGRTGKVIRPELALHAPARTRATAKVGGEAEEDETHAEAGRTTLHSQCCCYTLVLTCPMLQLNLASTTAGEQHTKIESM